MSPTLKYAVAGLGIVSTATVVALPFLTPAGRRGVVMAALIALTVQIAAFWGIFRFKNELSSFLAAWIGGTLVRLAVVAVVAAGVVRNGADGAIPTLLALAGFFFGLLLLEPVYFRDGPTQTVEA